MKVSHFYLFMEFALYFVFIVAGINITFADKRSRYEFR